MDDERTDRELVRRVCAGDRHAFAPLLGRHRGRTAAVVQRMLADAHEAEDVVQEAAVTAYLDLERLEQPERFGAWLCGIAVNLAKMRLRQRRTHVSLDDSGGRAIPASAWLDEREPSPEERLEAAEQLSLVHEAISLLPDHQRRLVLLAYLDGLSPREIGALLGRSAGSVRVALHRARTQLREQLSPLAPRPARKELHMIEMTVADVVVRLLPEEEPKLADGHRIVLLRERGGERMLPIWVGAAEGDSLAFQLAAEATPRPLTADLTARLLEAAGGRIERVLVSSLVENTFYAVVTVSNGGGASDVDARPSDALNLAVRVGAPIFVDDGVLEESALEARDLYGGLDRVRVKLGEPPLEGEWRTLSPELVRTVGSFGSWRPK